MLSPPAEAERKLFPRERLVDGSVVRVPTDALAWLRRDGGATLLIRGPASLTFRADTLLIEEGRAFVDSPSDTVTVIGTGQGKLHLVRVRASLEVSPKNGSTEAYVLAGEVRTETGTRAGPGERMVLGGEGGKATVVPALTWQDWTGGLATTDRDAEPPPFGVGTVGARRPGDTGAPRSPLAIQRMDVRVAVNGDLASTEVDELFFNGLSEKVEGVYTFRVPEGAMLTRFGVDRDGVVVWGRVKEKAAAAAQYQANVYQGSTEDPALLEWDAPGVYRARLYPIGPGERRRVVVRYTEWLGRAGTKGERRLYVFPMAAEGVEESLPRIEFFSANVDLKKAGATDVRVGMRGVRDGDNVMVQAHDLIPRADLAIELFDNGIPAIAYRIAHEPDLEVLPKLERDAAKERAKTENDYLAVPVRANDVPVLAGGVDLIVVVDTSAATDPAALAIARAAVGAMLTHMGGDDRAVVWAGDTALRSIAEGWTDLRKVDDALRRSAAIGLATVDRGGATDLGTMLAQAAAMLDPARRGAVVYVGDGKPTVGELALADLRDRLAKLARPARIFGLGVGQDADMEILKGVTRAGFAERLTDGAGAARAALRVLETAERPAWLGVSINLGNSVESVYPRELSGLVAGETVVLVGRIKGTTPRQLAVSTPAGEATMMLDARSIDDRGDLRARWAEGRLYQMLSEGAGRAALVDLGVRQGIITPVTSLYVPTRNEMSSEEREEIDKRRRRRAEVEQPVPSVVQIGMAGCSKRSREPASEERPERVADNKEQGTGTRAKGEEGSMGNPAAAAPAPVLIPTSAPEQKPAESNGESDSTRASTGDAPKGGESGGKRYGVAGPKDTSDSHVARSGAEREAEEFGMIGLLTPGGAGDPNAPSAPWGRDESQSADGTSARGTMWGDRMGDGFGSGGLGLSGIGVGGGGTATGQGLGSGSGRLGGAVSGKPPQIKPAGVTVNGRLPVEVVQRIVRQNYGRFRLCYEIGLRSNPNLQGKVSTQFTVQPDGSVANVANAGSDLPDANVVNCVVQAFRGLSFPAPEGGVVKVVYPIQLFPADAKPGEEKKTAPKPENLATSEAGGDSTRVQVIVSVDRLPHKPIFCSAAAVLPWDERAGLWRERLARVVGNAARVAAEYTNAVAWCEAPTWRERSRLLAMMLDSMPTVPGRVALWKRMAHLPDAADTLYRGLLARVRTPDEMRQLHSALGLRVMDPGLLEKAIRDAKTPEKRVTELRALWAIWPNDFNIALRLLDALDDAKDDAAGRELARQLRVRPDVDAHVRTEVGEYYLRLAARSESKQTAAVDEAEARRAFGEIVEFSPDEPVARRRLGDLLCAHGWFAEAIRQYETLTKLTPDDASVQLLLAAAAHGLGKLETAVQWAEKVGESGAPDDRGIVRSARAMAVTFLAWGRLSALKDGRTDEVVLLRHRAIRLLPKEQRSSQSVRVTLTWAHPELHPTLWSNALGAMMPAPEGDAVLGIHQVMLPKREGAAVEVRVQADEVEHAARLGAEAILTVAFDEGEETEKLSRRSVTFSRGGATAIRFVITNGEVQP